MPEPLRFVRPFRVRQYECDMYGHVNNANYLRYMQEAAIEASAAAGYDMARYNELGTLWLPHRTEIEYLQPLVYGDAFEIHTWVEDFRRVRSRRAYEFRRNGETAARASTDWVYLGAEGRRPVSIPTEMMAAFFPAGAPAEAARREPFPAAPPPPPVVVRRAHTVAWRDVDPAGHVNNANYLSLVEDTAMDVGRAFGWSLARMLERGLAWVIRQARIEYRQQARYADALETSTYLGGIRRSSAQRWYFVRLAETGDLAAQLLVQYVLIDLKTNRPAAIPDDLRRDFAPNVAVRPAGEGA
ncbi:MAG: thioesterase family protein [Chloroflexi bacterium]|nr:thioesterase family protein [Chloroflexota bacterium]